MPAVWLGSLCLGGAAVIWGGMYVVSAAVMRSIPPWTLLEMRFLLGLGVLGVANSVWGSWRVRPRDLGLLAAIGLIGYAVSIGMQFVGTNLSGAAMGSLVTAASPALIAAFAVWLLHERLRASDVAAIALGLAGITVVVGVPGAAAGGSQIGNLALVLAALTWALYTVLGRIATRRYGALAVTSWANVFGVLFVAWPAVRQAQAAGWPWPASPWVWLGVLYLGVVSTAAAFFLWNKGFEYLPARVGAVYFLLQPLVGGVLGWLLLGEQLGPPFLAGAALIGAGLVVSVRGARSPSEAG